MTQAGAPQPRSAATGGVTQGGTTLATELGGRLPCARCRYDLRGLSIRSVCPECGTPVQATLLTVVDPHASELQPIRHPLLTGMGVLLWGFCPVAAAAVAWGVRLAEFGWDRIPSFGVRAAVPAFAAMSGVGALAIIRPHSPGRQPWSIWSALLGILLYFPLVWSMWAIHVSLDGLGFSPYGPSGSATGQREWLRLAAQVFFAGIALCLRPNARILAARSLLLRTGRVDRQTLRALASVVLVSTLGDILRILSLSSQPAAASLLNQIGQLLVLAGSVLLTIGLVGVAADCWRIFQVIIEPPLAPPPLVPAAASPAGVRDGAGA